ncbi:restart primosome assembly protein PriC [Orbus hercynius]|uniref:Restart primosome assembly protein PriC n=1 Tax=Orbus hercynius TaxID=593135 RepID=A0A495RJV6_9GAMM|nr:primosomal replication protein PriC [Orbus hercynius]RKS87611.1 restart primosome assembly protein PriC [Orbus hercynius]
MTKNDMFLSVLKDKITLLSTQCAPFANTKLHAPCFDAQLFHYQGVLLNGYQPYLLELDDNFQKLTQLIAKDNHNDHLEQIVFLSTLIVNQLNALQREIATHTLRSTEQIAHNHATLHEQYARNLGYLNRLEALKYQLQQTPLANAVEHRKQLSTLESRIARCQYALSQIDQKIEQTTAIS